MPQLTTTVTSSSRSGGRQGGDTDAQAGGRDEVVSVAEPLLIATNRGSPLAAATVGAATEELDVVAASQVDGGVSSSMIWPRCTWSVAIPLSSDTISTPSTMVGVGG